MQHVQAKIPLRIWVWLPLDKLKVGFGILSICRVFCRFIYLLARTK